MVDASHMATPQQRIEALHAELAAQLQQLQTLLLDLMQHNDSDQPPATLAALGVATDHLQGAVDALARAAVPHNPRLRV